MLFGKNKKSTGIVSILALALAVAMLVAICLTGCTDADAQEAAKNAQATADEAKAAADAAVKPGDLAGYVKTEDLPEGGVTMAQVTEAINAALADYLKTADAVTTAAVNDAITAALAPYAKTADTVKTADLNNAINDAMANALAAYVKQADLNTALADYYKKGEIDTKLADYLKTADAVTLNQVNDAITTALAEYLKTTDLAAQLADYYTKAEVDQLVQDAAGGIVDGYITFEDWDAATELWFGYDAAADKQAFLKDYLNKSFADALEEVGQDYDDMWDFIAKEFFGNDEYSLSEDYQADNKTVVTIADFINKYYDIADNDASGVAGDAKEDYTLKLSLLSLHVRIRNTNLSDVAGDLFTDMVNLATTKTPVSAGSKELFDALLEAGTVVEDETTIANYYGYTVEIPAEEDGAEPTVVFRKVNSDNIEAVDAAVKAIYDYCAEVEGSRNLYGVVADFVDDDQKFTQDLTDYTFINAKTANEAVKAAADYHDLLKAILDQYDTIEADNPSVTDINIDNYDDEDELVVLVGTAEFDPSNTGTEGLFAEFDRINDENRDPIMGDGYDMVEAYVYKIKELKFVKAQNQAYLQMTYNYDQFIADNNIDLTSDLCVELSRIAAKHLGWCSELDYASMKKDTEDVFSFDEVVNNLTAELQAYYDSYQG